jgi:predicted dehydrogenase
MSTLIDPAAAAHADRSPTQGRGSRRAFLRLTTSATAFSLVPRHVVGGAGYVSPNGKTTLAAIGLGGQGMQNLAALLEFPQIQVVAVCDVERERSGYLSWNWSEGKATRVCGREPGRRMVEEHYARQQRSGKYGGCEAYRDYRELLEREDVDAVVVSTPDHTHAVITMAALKRRKHVYCEKPLTYSVFEARQITEAARAAGVATQLGNQGQAADSARVIQETLAEGVIGDVREVLVWSSARFWEWPSGEGRPSDRPPIPEGLDWDLWLGPAPDRPYHPVYHPWTWRNWWDFGTGLLGDLGSHKLSTVFKALELGHPIGIEASCTKLGPEIYPLGVVAHFNFPARGSRPPVTLSWHDGGLQPPSPPDLELDDRLQDVVYVGETGTLNGQRLVPDALADRHRRPPKTLPRSPGHYHEWVNACRGGPPAGANFIDHAGLLTEVCLLGNVAVRAQKRLVWDGPGLRVTNDTRANQLLHREYRQGWTL